MKQHLVCIAITIHVLTHALPYKQPELGARNLSDVAKAVISFLINEWINEQKQQQDIDTSSNLYSVLSAAGEHVRRKEFDKIVSPSVCFASTIMFNELLADEQLSEKLRLSHKPSIYQEKDFETFADNALLLLEKTIEKTTNIRFYTSMYVFYEKNADLSERDKPFLLARLVVPAYLYQIYLDHKYDPEEVWGGKIQNLQRSVTEPSLPSPRNSGDQTPAVRRRSNTNHSA